MYTEDQLREKAIAVFAQFPTATEVYATTDGNIFLQYNHARAHVGVKGKILTIERPFQSSDDTTTDKKNLPNAADTVAAIKEVTTLEGLEQYADDTRSTVQKAYEARKKAIEAADDILKAKQEPTGTNPDAGTEQATSNGLNKQGLDPEKRD